MKANFLFPNKYKKVGWMILIPSMVLGLVSTINHVEPHFFDWRMPAIFFDGFMSDNSFFGMTENNFLDELLAILVILSSLLVAFSKEKIEDEYIAKTRLESLVWATIANYVILILALVFIYDVAFFWVMIFNMFTIILFFIVRFNWLVYKLKKAGNHEE